MKRKGSALIIVIFISFLLINGVIAENRPLMLENLFTQTVEEDWFDKSFLAQIPFQHMKDLLHSLQTQLGEYEEIQILEHKYLVQFQRASMPAHIHLNEEGRIIGLFFAAPIPRVEGLEEVVDIFSNLSGEVSLLVLANGEPLAFLHPERELAVASAFKIGVLAAVKSEIEAGNLTWSTIVELEDKHKSLPSGNLQNWPVGSPLTVHTVAAKMISVSDNTATDLLMDLVGRERIEEVVSGNQPFLTTREAFLLKDPANQILLETYRRADEKERRMILEETKEMPLPSPDIFTNVLALDIEWFISSYQLYRLMEQVKDLPLMGINPGLAQPHHWHQIAYKGGSEPGVMNFSTWLTSKNGNEYFVTATWNHTERLDEVQFAGAYRSLLEQIRKMEQ